MGYEFLAPGGPQCFTNVIQKMNKLSGALDLNYLYKIDYRIMPKCGMVVEEWLAEDFTLKIDQSTNTTKFTSCASR